MNEEIMREEEDGSACSGSAHVMTIMFIYCNFFHNISCSNHHS